MNEPNTYWSNALEVLRSLQTKVGRSERERHKTINASIFLGEIVRNRGTFVWEGPNTGRKFDTIWEGMAAAMPEFDSLDWKGQYEHVKEYSPKIKNGFYDAREWFMEFRKTTIYYSPAYRVITLDPDYILPNGLTAAGTQFEHDSKRVYGQLNASIDRASASGGEEAVTALIGNVFDKVRDKLPAYQSPPSLTEEAA